MEVVNDFRLNFGREEYVPLVSGGMGVFFSSPELALEVCRLGGIGHISDAMSPYVSDKRYGTSFTKKKLTTYKHLLDCADKSSIKFDLEDVRQAQLNHVRYTMERKRGPGAIFINVMEKLNMCDPTETLRVRLNAALDGGIDGITLAAGLHCQSMKLMEGNPRFRDAKIGIIVSSDRALKIFLRSAERCNRLPDYIIVEGPLAGGHLGFGKDWADFDLKTIVQEVLALLKKDGLTIPVIAAGGVFTGTDAVEFLKIGAAGVQVATRFTVTKECGIPNETKQKYFAASENEVLVNCASPTGYMMRMLSTSPCLKNCGKPNCEAFGYILGRDGKCLYSDAWNACDKTNKTFADLGKMCICSHFSTSTCYTCGHFVYRLKDTSVRRPDGTYQLLTAEQVFEDYQFSKDHQIMLPKVEAIEESSSLSATL